ncbi:MAG: glutamate formimidoyltransferase [Clostridium sp.]
MKVLMAEVNISEGKDLELVNQVKEELLLNNDVKLIDLNSDKDHNRTVFTYTGEPNAVLEGTKRLSKKAVELIDMTTHKGSHPRMGAVDVVPFIPVKDVTTEEAVEIAKEYGKYLGTLGVSVYFYEDAHPDKRSLVKIRKGEYEALKEKMENGFLPDEGPTVFNPKSGGTVTGVRFPLIAFNVNLKSTDLDVAKKIVKAVRGASGGYQCVRAIALPVEGKDLVQISMNLINYEKTPIHRVFETIKLEARSFGIIVESTELVGPVPVMALEDMMKFYLQVHSFDMEQVY